MDKGLALAIEKAGSRSKLAAILGVSRQAVQVWDQVPIYLVPNVEKMLHIPRWRLRPDLWEKPSAQSVRSSR